MKLEVREITILSTKVNPVYRHQGNTNIAIPVYCLRNPEWKSAFHPLSRGNRFQSLSWGPCFSTSQTNMGSFPSIQVMSHVPIARFVKQGLDDQRDRQGLCPETLRMFSLSEVEMLIISLFSSIMSVQFLCLCAAK